MSTTDDTLRIIKVDRSRIVARQECPMLRYWNYHHGGMGIVPRSGPAEALAFGIALHACIEYVLRAQMEGRVPDMGMLEAQHINPFCTATFNQLLLHGGAGHTKADHLSKEQAHLLRMLVYGWVEHRLPALMEEYTIVGVEKEYEVPFPHRANLKLMLRVDAVLRRKADGVLHILDLKSLKYLSDDWMVHHEHSLQTLLYLWALGQAEEEYIGGVLYEGFLKGGSRRETNKAVPWAGWEVAQSPLCYVYTDGAGHYKTEWTAAKGWRKIPIFDWSYQRVMDLLTAHYAEKGESLPFWPNIPPVRPTNAQVEQVVSSLAQAEAYYDGTIQCIRDFEAEGDPHLAEVHRKLHIPQHLGRCYKYGTKYGCPYTSLCHGGSDPDDPTQWVPRTPHHDTETQQED